jgi:FKBP-type peptidyl-prolyl cis-trans isomerase FkpA
VSVNYNGTLLSGKQFDSSDKAGKPIDFPIGQGAVIPGWDEGIALLNKGSRAILLIPSALAYGTRGAGADIPANAPLRFEVELVDVQ